MQDTAPDDMGIVLVRIADQYWLVEGEAYIQAMLSGLESYPTPVRCYRFRDQAHLDHYIPDTTSALWAINPLIVERLRRDSHLTEEDHD